MRDQLVDPQVQSTEGAGQSGADVDLHGLPPEIHARVMQIRPGEGGAEVLAELLKDFPAMEAQILEVASAQVGMSTVKQAMSIREGNPAAGISQRNQDEIRATIGADAFGTGGPTEAPAARAPAATTAEPAQSESVPGDLIIGRDKPEEKKKKEKAEPAWVEGARRYNKAHPTLVDEFNDLTGEKYWTDELAGIDPQLIARWQREHGIAADGKVGPQTVATARTARGSANAVAQSDAGPKGELIDV